MTIPWRSEAAGFRTGSGLNAWKMRALGWLKDPRICQVSGSQDVVLRPLHRPALDGYLAAELGPFLVELRIPDNWDHAVRRPCVLVHGIEDGEAYAMNAAGGEHQDLVVGDRFVCGRRYEVEVLAIDELSATVRLMERDLRVTRLLAEPRT